MDKPNRLVLVAVLLAACSVQSLAASDGIPIVAGDSALGSVSRSQPQAEQIAAGSTATAADHTHTAGTVPAAPSSPPHPASPVDVSHEASRFAAAADSTLPRYSAALEQGVDQALVDAYLEASGKTLLSSKFDPELVQAINAAVVDMRIAGDVLTVSFDHAQLVTIAKDFEQYLYNGIAGPVMAFMVISLPRGNRVLSRESSLAFLGQLNAQAQRLSFNVFYPLMDLTDLQTISPEIILAHDDQALARAAARYDAEYFISAALEQEAGGAVRVVWNLYDRHSQRLYGTTSAGLDQEVAAQLAESIARAVHAHSDAVQTAMPGEDAASAAESVFNVGPRQDMVRIAVSNVNSLHDLAELNLALITYGFDSEGQIVGIRGGAVYMDIPTSASPEILDGSMSHARDFRKTGDWQYQWVNSAQH